MKPLVLNVYPLREKVGRMAERGYIVNRRAVPLWTVDYMDNRLTDAQLAAEYWYQDSKCRHEQWIETVRGDDGHEDWEHSMQARMYEHLNSLHRFATLPHASETNYE